MTEAQRAACSRIYPRTHTKRPPYWACPLGTDWCKWFVASPGSLDYHWHSDTAWI